MPQPGRGHPVESPPAAPADGPGPWSHLRRHLRLAGRHPAAWAAALVIGCLLVGGAAGHRLTAPAGAPAPVLPRRHRRAPRTKAPGRRPCRTSSACRRTSPGGCWPTPASLGPSPPRRSRRRVRPGWSRPRSQFSASRSATRSASPCPHRRPCRTWWGSTSTRHGPDWRSSVRSCSSTGWSHPPRPRAPSSRPPRGPETPSPRRSPSPSATSGRPSPSGPCPLSRAAGAARSGRAASTASWSRRPSCAVHGSKTLRR